jgi:hypothetical protein
MPESELLRQARAALSRIDDDDARTVCRRIEKALAAYDPAKAVGLRPVTDADAVKAIEARNQHISDNPNSGLAVPAMLAALREVCPLGVPVVPDGGKEATS